MDKMFDQNISVGCVSTSSLKSSIIISDGKITQGIKWKLKKNDNLYRTLVNTNFPI